MPPPRKRRDRASALLALLIASPMSCRGPSSEDAATAPPPPRPVEVARVARRDVPIDLEWTATLEGYVSADVRPRVEGYVLGRLYEEGTRVEKDAPLFRIDDRTYRQALDSARAALAEARAELLRARADYARVEPLANTGAVSREEVTNAFAAAEAAQAGVAARRAAVRDARLALAWTTVRSPVDGVAGLRQVEIGDLVRPTDVLTRVASLDPMRASFSITEAQYLNSANLIRSLAFDENPADASSARDAHDTARAPGFDSGGGTAMTRGALELVLADGTVYPHRGRFEAVGLGIDPNTGTLPLESLFPNPELLLRPGQFARIRLRSAEGRDALVVPTRAIMELQGVEQIAVVDPAQKVAEIRTVEIALRLGDIAVVEEGAREGELVVVEGVQGLETGTPVDPSPEGRREPTPNGGVRGR